MLTRRDALQHLLRLGLLSPGELVTQDIRATEYVGRNHLVRIERSNALGLIGRERKPGAILRRHC